MEGTKQFIKVKSKRVQCPNNIVVNNTTITKRHRGCLYFVLCV